MVALLSKPIPQQSISDRIRLLLVALGVFFISMIVLVNGVDGVLKFGSKNGKKAADVLFSEEPFFFIFIVGLFFLVAVASALLACSIIRTFFSSPSNHVDL